MYLVYESLYGELLYECESTNIIGLYNTKEKAIDKVNKMIKQQLGNDSNYVLDIEHNNINEDNFVRLFYNNQDNWNCYYEILIIKVEVE